MIIRTSFILLRLQLRSLHCHYKSSYRLPVFYSRFISNLRNTPLSFVNTTNDSYLPTDGFNKSRFASDDVGQMMRDVSDNVSKSERFIKMIKMEGELDVNGISNILNYYEEVKHRILRDEKVKEEIKSSKEFLNFLQALEKNILELNAENLAASLSLCYWFKLPTDHDLYVMLMLQINDKIDDLPYKTAVSLDSTIKIIDKDDKNDWKQELLKNLNIRMKNVIIKSMNDLTDEDIKTAIQYVAMNGDDDDDWPDETLIRLSMSALENSYFLGNRYTFGRCFKLIQCIKNEDEKNLAKEKLFKKIYSFMMENKSMTLQSLLCHFLKTYSFYVYKEKQILDEQFYNDVIDVASRTNNAMCLMDLNMALILTNHIRMDVFTSVIKFLQHKDSPAKFPTKKAFLKFFSSSLQLLSFVHSSKAISKFNTDKLDSILKNVRLLDNVEDWGDLDLGALMRIVISLASMEVFPDNLLNYLSSKINETVIEDKSLGYLVLVLNQAVVALNNNHSKSFFVNENLISSAVDKVYKEEELVIPEDFKFLMNELENTLESITEKKSSLLFYKSTKLGQHLPITVAVNENKEFFEFLPVNDSHWIEDVLPPKNYKLVVIMPFLKKHYSRRKFLLADIGKIRLRSLQSMGFGTVPIFFEKWVNLSDKDKKTFLLKNIFNAKVR